MQSLEELKAYVRDIMALEYVAGILNWDSATNMPRCAVEQRAVSIGALSVELHNRKKSPRISELLAKIDESQLSQSDQAQVKEIKIFHNRALKVPEDLARAIAESTERAEAQWQIALQENSFQLFLPDLKNVIGLKREEGDVLARDGNRYDALLSDYETGMTQESLDALFSQLRPRLIALRDKIMGCDRSGTTFTGKFPKEKQLQLAQLLAQKFGYDLNNGRIDLVVHPFCCGSGKDVRITTRIDENDPLNCLYSTIHESGHGSYEQNVRDEYNLTAIGGGTSFGVHESQSRICENQLARSKYFTQWLFKEFNNTFGEIGSFTEWDFYRYINQVKKGFIRTESDEIQYNLHIILRYELERDLVSGSLEVNDLEDAWNQKFKINFGYEVPQPKLGVLQDVHWSYGLIGYFPTYTLGNVYAGCLYEALQNKYPKLNHYLTKGDPSLATRWLKKHVQQYGGLKEPKETIQDATGKEISPEPLLRYLEEKFTELYEL